MSELDTLIQLLAKLPGLGPRSARRAALYMIKRREAVLISDFQRSGWSGSEEVRFPDGMSLSTVSVASATTANLAVPSVSFARASFSGQERITVTAGLSNKEIAIRLNVGVRTVETHRERIMRKLNIHTVAGLTKFAIAKGLISLKMDS